MKLYKNEFIFNINLFNSLLELFKDTNIFMFENFNSDTFNIGTLNVYSLKLDSIIYIISNIQDLLSWINMVRMIKFLSSNSQIFKDIDNMIVFENKCNLLKINTIKKYDYILQYNENKFLDISVFKYDVNIYRKIKHIKLLHQDILK
jgi:hypothetical protein